MIWVDRLDGFLSNNPSNQYLLALTDIATEVLVLAVAAKW
jgi:hypothetical protein